MKTQRRAMAVIYVRSGSAVKYLVLHRVLNWRGWEFVKGHVEGNEAPEDAAVREVAEETGISKIISLKKLPKGTSWVSGGAKCECSVYVAEVPSDSKVILATDAREHDAYEWCNYAHALRLLTYDNTKEVLRMAQDELSKRQRGK